MCFHIKVIVHVEWDREYYIERHLDIKADASIICIHG